MIQESHNDCNGNNLRADEEKYLIVARTKQREKEEDSGIMQFHLVAVLGIHCCVDWPALLPLAPVPFRHEAARRVDDSPVPVSPLLSRPGP